MRFDADAIEDQYVEIAEAVHRCGRNYLKIGCVGKIVKTVCDDRELSVDDFERRYLKIVSDAKRSIRLNRMRYQLWQPAAEMRGFKNVLKML